MKVANSEPKDRQRAPISARVLNGGAPLTIGRAPGAAAHEIASRMRRENDVGQSLSVDLEDRLDIKKEYVSFP
jgi:hypothetical protein